MDSGSDSEGPSDAKFAKFCGAAKYDTKFNPKWTKTHPFIVADSTDSNHFRCTICNRSVSCKHQGWKDVERCISRNSHKELEKIKSTTKVDLFSSFAAHNTISDQNICTNCSITRAEVKVAHIIAQHNLPLATTDHLSFADIFPDSKITKQFSSAKSKTTCMLNGAIAPFCANLVDMMKTQPYSLAVDCSNDTGLEKMNPLTVCIYDVNTNKVEFRILDMCCTSRNNSATAACIFDKINEKVIVHDIPWSNCVAFGVDNTSVNLGKRNSIKTRVQQQVQSSYFVGCPCHLVHNIACKASDAFQLEMKVDMEDFCVDIFYYFDKSTKRKAILSDFCSFCNTNYKQAVKQVNTRWLSLEKAVTRNLELFEGSKSYFRSTQESQPKFKRLRGHYEDPMTEIYLLFYQSVFPVFTNFNRFLQRDDPCIYAIYLQMTSFLKKPLGKFVQVKVIRKSLPVVTDVDFLPPENQLDDDNIFVGIATIDKLMALEEEGDISPRAWEMF